MKVPKPRKVSSGNYFIQLRLGGESISVTAVNEKECRRQAALIKAEYLAGVKKRKATGANKTLRQAIDDYIVARSNVLSPSTIRSYRSYQRNRFQSIMDKPIKEIKNWAAVINKEAEEVSPKYLKNVLGLISSALSENGVELPDNITLPKGVSEERPWLEPEEIPVFVEAVKGQSCEIPALLALHSLRRSEIYGLSWDEGDIDLSKKLLRIRKAVVKDEHHKFVKKDTNKTEKSTRTVPIMIPELFEALEKVKDKTGPLVTCHPITTWRRINRICKSHGLPLVGVHGLRHSFASLAYHLGLSELETMQIGGWADLQTMRKIYTHLAERDRLKAENKMAEFYKNANKNANKSEKS